LAEHITVFSNIARECSHKYTYMRMLVCAHVLYNIVDAYPM